MMIRELRTALRQDRTKLGSEALDAIGDRGHVEHIRQELSHSLLVTQTAFGRSQNGPRDHPFYARKDRAIWFPEHLVEAMREKYHTVAVQIVIDAVIVFLHSVAVPMPGHHFDRN